ncbi:hypothetical protein HY413_00570 [Candidatus Kaiserbacteria bacterium]|nr:hypothetical protein [Candidatus Kaiserbacteria bacterium]
MGWTRKNGKDRKKVRADARALSKSLDSCKSHNDCLLIANKMLLLRNLFPADVDDPTEKVLMQLVASKDARDHEFILNYFPDSQAAKLAENELAVLNGGG